MLECLRTACALACIAAVPVAVLAQPAYPSKPVRVVVPFPPGGAGDVIARLVQPRLAESLMQPVLVDNRPGATGNIGAEHVAKSQPDGHTVLFSVSSLVISPFLAKVPFDVVRDFSGVTQLIRGSYVLVADPGLGVSTLDELLAAARRSPGKINYGSFGNGSGAHLAMELLRSRTGIDVAHVPYKGLGPMKQALLTGEIAVAFDPSVSAVPHIRTGKLRALATTGPEPVGALPSVPTIAASLPGYDADGWQGVWVPAGTPRPVVQRLQQEIGRALHSNEVARKLRDSGFEPVGNPPDQFDFYVRSELAKWGKLIREHHIQGN